MAETPIDLNAAVDQGIITEHQAARLRELSLTAPTAQFDAPEMDFSQSPEDEPFRFMRGFADLFTALGVSIFSCGLYLATPFIVMGDVGEGAGDVMVWATFAVISLVVIAFHMPLSSYLIRTRRLPLSGLVISISLAIWTATFLTWAQVLITLDHSDLGNFLEVFANGSIWIALGAAAVLVVFYLRYRLPSTLFVLALFAVSFLSFYVHRQFDIEWQSTMSRIYFGGLGVLVFVSAMIFENKDRRRTTRLSECAFWLHIVAAPVMLYALLAAEFLDQPALWSLIVVFLGLSFVALLIDRRSILVSGLLYLGIALGTLIGDSSMDFRSSFGLTMLIVGAVALSLGIGWSSIRKTVMNFIPDGRFKQILPMPDVSM